MSTIAEVLAILALFASLGAAIDALLLPAQLNNLKEKMEILWVHISDIKVVDYAYETAILAQRLFYFVFGGKHKWGKLAVFSFILSSLVSIITIVSGYTLDSYINETLGFTDYDLSLLDELLISFQISIYEHPIESISLVVTNYLFDFITIIVTMFLISKLKHSRRVYHVPIIILDATIALIISGLCYTSSEYIVFGDSYHGYVYFENKILDVIITNIENIIRIIIGIEYYSYWEELGSSWYFFYSVTTLLPTIIFLSVLFILILSSFSFMVCRFIICHLLALSVEKGKSIFFYTGTFIGLLAVIGKMLVALFNFL